MEVHKLKEKKERKSILLDKKFFKSNFKALKEDSLYFAKYEVSNGLFNQFLEQTRSNPVSQENWKTTIPHGYYWASNYASHEQFKNHPVVNISKKQAEQFCEWLTSKYNSYKELPYKTIQFRLPTEEEWEQAARISSISVFPWGGPYTRNAKGNYLANFSPKWSQAENMNRYDTLSQKAYLNQVFSEIEDQDGHPVLAPINSFYPNKLGGYQFAGNAAEMLSDEGITKGGSWASKAEFIQIKNQEEWNGEASPFVGFRVFMEVIER